jgi:hypothetical protein
VGARRGRHRIFRRRQALLESIAQRGDFLFVAEPFRRGFCRQAGNLIELMAQLFICSWSRRVSSQLIEQHALRHQYSGLP